MATTGEPFGLFWDSDGGDRTYSADSFERWLSKFFTSGVFNGDLQVSASSGMTLEVSAGYTNANGKVKFWNAPFNVTLDAANSTYPRIDTVVIRRDNVNRQITCEKVTGQYSGDTPQPTAPTRNNEIYELVLAQIYIPAGSTEVIGSNITDTRPDINLCGYITGTVEELDFSAFTAQFEAYFAEFKSQHEHEWSVWETAQRAAYAAWFATVQAQQVQDKADWDAWYAALQEELHELPPDTAEYLQIEIDEIKQSGTSGSILNITTTESSLEGKTITVTNGTEVRTGVFDENLECVIAGYKGVGEVTISASDGIDTATTVVTIPYFGNYTFNIAFWAATVNIQGDDNLKGATITVKDSDDLTVGTVVLNVITGRGVFNASKADTYTFNYSYQGTDYSESLIVDEQITYSLSLSAGFNWSGWVDTAQYLDSTDYNSLDEVLADEEAVRELCLEHNCVDYLADIATANEDVETIINNDLFAKWANNSDYSLDILGANVAIKALIDAADKYFYGEWALMPQVPTMTSNTAPYGTVSASSYYSLAASSEPFRAFDGDGTTQWRSNDEVPAWIQYQFTEAVNVRAVQILSSTSTRFLIQYSDDGITFTDVGSEIVDTSHTSFISNIGDMGSHTYWRLRVLDGATRINVATLQFYTWGPKGNVPVMTSNSAPYGEASAESASTNYQAYKAFNNSLADCWQSTNYSGSTVKNWIRYKFTSPVCLKKISYMQADPSQTSLLLNSSYTVWYSNDDTNRIQIGEAHSLLASENIGTDEIENDVYALYWWVLVESPNLKSGSNYYFTFRQLQFYGRELTDLVPPMISNTLPSGECFASSNHPSSNNYFAFDKIDSNSWVSTPDATNNYVGYEFDNVYPILMATVKFVRFATTGKTMPAKSFTLQASDDGLTYGSALATFNVPAVTASTAVSEFTVSFAEQNKKYFELACADSIYIAGTGNISVKELQLFGKDYSEKEFEEGTTKKWLYDHGVELKTANTPYGGGNNTYINYESSRLIVGITDGASAIIPNWSVDFTSYNLARAKITNNYNVDKNDLRAMNSSGSYIGGLTFTTALLPNNIGFDVSSINQEGKLGICVQGATNTNTNGHTELAELWLE